MATNAIRAMASETRHLIEFRPSIKAFLFKSFTGWMVLLFSILLWGIPLIFVAITALGYRMTHFELSGDRLFMRRGILSRSEEEIELYRIKDVKADFSIVQQLFGVGNIQIISSDATGLSNGRRATFRANNVPDARLIREELRERVEHARKVKGVREFDA